MNLKLSSLVLLICLMALRVAGQDISFNKKSGEFRVDDKVIAKLEDEKVKPLGGKNFYLKDAAGQKTLLSYTLSRWEDTLGRGSTYYYFMQSAPLGLSAYRPNFSGMMNTFREVGEHIVAKNLLQPDGSINEPAMKEYFAAATADMGDYPARVAAMQDSMIALTNIPAAPVERDMRREVTANQYGKIGQGNTVIGTWEMLESKSPGVGSSTDYQFRIKNMKGGIVCISWIRISGAHTYLFANGARSEDIWTVPDFIKMNPIQNKEQYAAELAKRCIRAGLL
jgi:hypothetical protein